MYMTFNTETQIFLLSVFFGNILWLHVDLHDDLYGNIPPEYLPIKAGREEITS